MASVNERLLDFQVAQQIKWIRYGNREATEALKILNRVDAQLKEALLGVDLENLRFTEARAVALKAQVAELINATHARLAPVISESAREATVVAAEAEAAAFARTLPAGLDVTTPNLGVLQTAATLKPFNGAVLGDWVNQLRENDLKRTWTTILDGITSGTTTDDIIRTLVGSRSLGYKDGVREVTRRGTEALVRTSINHATNTGRQMVWEANSDIIKGVRWVATLDTRTTPICQQRDGRVGPVTLDPNWKVPDGSLPLDPPMARPPAHPNCRSTTVAVTKSWRELGFDMDEMPVGTRASMDGQVPGNLTYFDWLRRQSDDVQKDVLGPTRWRIWKEQGITPDRFINDKGRLLTLGQLKSKIGKELDVPTKPFTPVAPYSTYDKTPAFEKQLSAVDSYIQGDATTLNGILRDGFEVKNEELADMGRALDAHLSNGTYLQKPTTFYRAVHSEQLEDMLTLEPGDVYTDRGFMSVTQSKSALDKAILPEIEDLQPGVIKIRMPEGAVLGRRVKHSTGAFADQDEFIFPRGTQLRVVSVNRDLDVPEIVVEYITESTDAYRARMGIGPTRLLNKAIPVAPLPKFNRVANPDLAKLEDIRLTQKLNGRNITPAEIDEILEARVKKADLFTRLDRRNLTKILKEGRFKSQFETGKSAGALAPEMRRNVERNLMALADDLPDAKRPIYGYMADKDGYQLATRLYGDVSVKFKKKAVQSRTTFTVGDSLDMNRFAGEDNDFISRYAKSSSYQFNTVPQPITSPNYRAVGRTYDNLDDYLGTWDPDMPFDNLKMEYWEVQIHNGASVDDIEEVIFYGGSLGEQGPDKTLAEALSRANIPWRIVEGK